MLRRDIYDAQEGAIRRRLEGQTEQAWCLTIATNAISTWTADDLGLAADELRAQGRLVDPALLAHISPARSEPIGLFGAVTVDVDAKLARLWPSGHRPLRCPPVGAMS